MKSLILTLYLLIGLNVSLFAQMQYSKTFWSNKLDSLHYEFATTTEMIRVIGIGDHVKKNMATTAAYSDAIDTFTKSFDTATKNAYNKFVQQDISIQLESFLSNLSEKYTRQVWGCNVVYNETMSYVYDEDYFFKHYIIIEIPAGTMLQNLYMDFIKAFDMNSLDFQQFKEEFILSFQ